MSDSKQRIFVLGLDGVPYSLLKQFTEEGIMPKFSSIIQEGTLLPMQASIPEVSSTSWTTFMTGVNPGRHKIYGFMDLKEASYEMYFVRSYDIKSQTLWDIAAKYGKRSIILNIPSTYPARPLNGILTAGFVAPDLEKATYPKEAYEYLKETGYKTDVEVELASSCIEAFKKDLDLTFEKRKEAFKYFLKNEYWDIFIATITETDRLHHFFFDGFRDKNHPLHNYLINFYQNLDALIGYFYKEVKNGNTHFLILSDHGFTAIKKEVYLNSWLREKEFLSFKTPKPESLNEINPESQAFCLDPARIYINLKGKYPYGCVLKKDYESIRNRLKEELLEFEFNGEDIIKKVFFKEELYSGPHIEGAPDIILLSQPGFDLKGGINKEEIFGNGKFSGMHTQDNALLFIDKKINPDNINIVDITPTILNLMGLGKEAESLDGRIIN